MLISCIWFGLMGFVMKLAFDYNDKLTGFDAMLVRWFVMLPVYYITAKILGVNLVKIKRWNFIILFFRCVIGAVGMTMLFMSLKELPPSIAFMIYNLNPLFVTFFAFILFWEDFQCITFIWAVFACGGVGVVAFGRRDESTFHLISLFLCLGAAFLSSLAVASMRRVNKQIHYIFSPYYLWIAWMFITLAAFIYDPGLIHIFNYDIWDWLFLLGAGWLSLVGQLLLSLALKYADASSAAPLLYINCLVNVFTDLFYFKFEFYLMDIMGAAIITIWVFIPLLILLVRH